MYLRDTTVISPYDLLLFGGDISVQHQVSPIPFITSCVIPLAGSSKK